MGSNVKPGRLRPGSVLLSWKPGLADGMDVSATSG